MLKFFFSILLYEELRDEVVLVGSFLMRVYGEATVVPSYCCGFSWV